MARMLDLGGGPTSPQELLLSEIATLNLMLDEDTESEAERLQLRSPATPHRVGGRGCARGAGLRRA